MLAGVNTFVEDNVVVDHVARLVDSLVGSAENSQVLESVASVLVFELVACVPSHDWVKDLALEELERSRPEGLVAVLGNRCKAEDSTNVESLWQWEPKVGVSHVDILHALAVTIGLAVEAHGISAVPHGEGKTRGVVGSVEGCSVEGGVLEGRRLRLIVVLLSWRNTCLDVVLANAVWGVDPSGVPCPVTEQAHLLRRISNSDVHARTMNRIRHWKQDLLAVIAL